MLPEADLIRLRHMLDAANEAINFISGHSRVDLNNDRMLSFALVRAIEIIGEAASKTNPQTREISSQIPWPAIIGMRNHCCPR